MSNDESVSVWLARLKSGEVAAAQPIWQRYLEDLVRLARKKLGTMPRRVVDEEDVVAVAFDGFLRGVEQGKFAKLDDRQDLWQVLLMLVERRAVSVRRHEFAQKRGGGKVRGESIFENQRKDSLQPFGLAQCPDREVLPDEAAELTDHLRELLDELAEPLQRQIALGKLEGKTNRELKDELGVSLRTIERKLAIVRLKWGGEAV
ncbi:MAG: ECF-type sigma factor [Pirellulaceae bacterium]|nr:hypothetical protein [Planctomycetales bacterium]